MTNEQLVAEIRNGYSVTDNMQLLYQKNLPLIKKIIQPYYKYEETEDLLQEAYFGLYEAVKHYETSENVLFMTYATFWIRQAVQRYINKCGAVVRIPSHTKQKKIRYKKTVIKLTQDLGCIPTREEIAEYMAVNVSEIERLEIYSKSIASLDSPVNDDSDQTLIDSIQDDCNLENNIINEMYDQYSKNELWSIVEDYTTERENHIIREYFLYNKSMPEIAKNENITVSRIREIREKGLRKLKFGKAKRELIEKFDIVDSGIYKNGYGNFTQHNNTSKVEYIAIRRVELQEEYEKKLQEYLNYMPRKRECL